MARKIEPPQQADARLVPPLGRQTAIPELKHRIDELKADPDSVQERPDMKFKATVLKIDNTLSEIFGVTILNIDVIGNGSGT